MQPLRGECPCFLLGVAGGWGLLLFVGCDCIVSASTSYWVWIGEGFCFLVRCGSHAMVSQLPAPLLGRRGAIARAEPCLPPHTARCHATCADGLRRRATFGTRCPWPTFWWRWALSALIR